MQRGGLALSMASRCDTQVLRSDVASQDSKEDRDKGVDIAACCACCRSRAADPGFQVLQSAGTSAGFSCAQGSQTAEET